VTVSLDDVKNARQRLAGIIEVTPLDYSRTLSQMCGNTVYIKLENLQRTGSFKIRGAYNKIATLTAAERARGVIAASAGNHAQGVACAAKMLGIPCMIVMPAAASLSKIEATRGYGADVTLVGDSFDDAYAYARDVAAANGSVFIHAFDDELIMAGQGTVGLELMEQEPQLDAILVPIGGGGLISGLAAAVKAIRPQTQVIGVEAAGAASFTAALAQRHVVTLERVATIADGIAVKRVGEHPFAQGAALIDHVLTVEDEEIARAMVFLLERCKVVSEGASAAAAAALLTGKVALRDKRIAVVLSGGNVDVHFLSRIIEHGLVAAGRYTRFVTTLSDRPGALSALLADIAACGANVSYVEHHRLGQSLVIGQVEVQIGVETRNTEHIGQLCDQLKEHGYDVSIC